MARWVLHVLRQTAGIAWICAAIATGAAAQDSEIEEPTRLVVRSQILTISSERLFPETQFGQALTAELNEERRIFVAENQRLAEVLRSEELALTERRATLSREEFAILAEEFDARVQAARSERDLGEADIEARAAAQEREFLGRVQPILAQIMSEAGAVVLIEANTAFLRADAIDITALAIARINAATQQTETPGEPDGREPAESDADPEGAPLKNDQ